MAGSSRSAASARQSALDADQDAKAAAAAASDACRIATEKRRVEVAAAARQEVQQNETDGVRLRQRFGRSKWIGVTDELLDLGAGARLTGVATDLISPVWGTISTIWG